MTTFSRPRGPLLGALALPLLIAAGCEFVNPAVSFTCTEAVLTADRATATVDNTDGEESFETGFIRVYDGRNTLLYESSYGGPVGANETDVNLTYAYTTPPTANPIILVVVAPAGGSLATDTVWYRATGSCAGLPTASVAAVPALSEWSMLALLGMVPALAALRRGRRRH